jgi:hypothetical protein
MEKYGVYDYRIEWLSHRNRIENNRFPKLTCYYATDPAV